MKLADLKKILIGERHKALKDVLKFIVPARVLDISQQIATIESNHANLFESSDILGLVFSHEGTVTVRQLGTVIDSSQDILTVFADLDLKEGWDFRITDYEPLIAFDLQMGLIERIEEGELHGFEEIAVNLFFKSHSTRFEDDRCFGNWQIGEFLGN